jgi:hypothetical protein
LFSFRVVRQFELVAIMPDPVAKKRGAYKKKLAA